MPTPQEEIEEINRLREIEEIKALRAKPEAPRVTKTPLESAISGAADTLTFGFSDELGAGGKALLSAPFKDESLGQLYDTYLNEQRRHKAQAEEDNPGFYLAGNIGGAILPALATGGSSAAVQAPGALARAGQMARGFYSAITPAAGRSLGSNLLRGAAAGALTAAGHSNARPTDSLEKAEEFAGDVLSGAGLGAGTTALFSGIGAMGKFAASKLRPAHVGSVMLGLPTEAADLYVKNPAAVNAAKSRPDLVRDLGSTIDKLKRETIEGSAASRKILSDEGVRFSRAELADIAEAKAADIIKRSEGFLDDADEAAVSYLKAQANKLRGSAAELAEEGISANRLKDLIKSTRENVNYEVRPGQFMPAPDRIRAGLAQDYDVALKARSPAYMGQMKDVARDAALLEDVSSLAGSDQAMENLLGRVQRDRAYFPAQKIAELDKRMGTNFLQDLKLSQAKEAFQRGAAGPGGSRNVNLYKEIGREIGEKSNIPFAGSLGALAGATVDKYGPAIGKQLLDASAKTQKMLQSSEGLRQLGKYAPMIKNAASRGPAALVTLNQVLLQDPEYRKILSPKSEEGP